MPRSIFGKTFSWQMLAGSALGAVVMVVMALLIWPISQPKNESESEVGRLADSLAQSGSGSSSSTIIARAAPSSLEHSKQAELTPDEVIDKFDMLCNLKRGAGSASELGIVTIAESGAPDPATRFSVLDRTGALNKGELPFIPFQSKLGKRPYGEVITGFGGINARPGYTLLSPEGERLQIFFGDRLVHDREHVWLFDVATDGSSFFVIEPLGSENASRVAISNLNQGTEIHHYIDTLLEDSDGTLAYLAAYTADSEEVYLQPASASTTGIGVHYFFSAKEEVPPRKVLVPDRGLDDLVVFTSSEEGYYFFDSAHSTDSLHIMKARFDWSTGLFDTVWHQEGPVGTNASRVDASSDGDWLLFTTGTSMAAGRPANDGDRSLSVLDSATGEIVFSLPTRNTDALMQRLANVLPNQSVADDVGWFDEAFFVGNDTLVVRWTRLTDGDLDETASFIDVFDMNSISLDAEPLYRLASNEHRFNPCASKGFPGTLLVAENGRLAYSGLD